MAKKQTPKPSITLSYREALDKETRLRYDKKLTVSDIEQCPFEMKDNWSEELTNWPEVTYPEIVCYLIESPGLFTRESMRSYKSLDSYNYFDSGYVRTVFSKKISFGKILMKTEVNHSQRTSEPPCRVWIVLKDNGSVIASHCTCMAGLGEACSHIGALLFKVEACIRYGYNKEACTSKPCKWNKQFTKKVQSAQIIDMDFSRPKRKAKDENQKTVCNPTTPKRKKQEPKPLTEEEQENFFQQLHDNGIKSVVLTTHDTLFSSYRPTPVLLQPSLPKTLNELFYKESVKFSSIDKLKETCNTQFQSLKVSEESAVYLESTTKNQADSIVWHEQRVGRISASKVYNVLRTNQDAPAPSLLKSICFSTFNRRGGSKGTGVHVESLQWGIEHEKDGVEDLVMALEETHTSVAVSKAGLCINTKYPHLGASPDRYIECSCCGKGVVEVKCPFSQRSIPSVESIKHVYFDEGHCLKPTHQYYSQVQMQMNLCEVEYCYLVVWTPKGSLISREERNKTWFEETLPILEKFFLYHIMPVLVTGSIEWESELKSPLNSKDRNVKLYCICDGVEDERPMVRCSNFRYCQKTWFHMECLNMTSAPKGRWLCPYCKK